MEAEIIGMSPSTKKGKWIIRASTGEGYYTMRVDLPSVYKIGEKIQLDSNWKKVL